MLENILKKNYMAVAGGCACTVACLMFLEARSIITEDRMAINKRGWTMLGGKHDK